MVKYNSMLNFNLLIYMYNEFLSFKHIQTDKTLFKVIRTNYWNIFLLQIVYTINLKFFISFLAKSNQLSQKYNKYAL